VTVFSLIHSTAGPQPNRRADPAASDAIPGLTEPARLGPVGRSPRGGLGSPATRLLIHLAETGGSGEPVTQTEAVRTLRLSQPTVSRSIASLLRQGLVHPQTMWCGGRGSVENAYALAPAGERAAREAVAAARASRSADPELSLGDLVDLYSGLTLTDLLSLPAADRTVEGIARSVRRGDLRAAARSVASDSSLAGATLPTPFIGRWSERRELLRALARLGRPGARGEVRLLLGPAGQGKSRLLEFAAAVAPARGVRVLQGQVLRDAALPFSPFEEMMESLRRASAGPGEYRARSRAARSLPQRLLEYLDLIARGPPVPLLIVVDDLHDAERPALSVFRFLARNLPTLERPVLLLASARSDEPAPAGAHRSGGFFQLVDEISRPTPSASVVVVPPLSASESREVADLALDVGEPRPPDSALRTLVARSCGNPLFLVEGARELQHAVVRAPAGSAGVRLPVRTPSSLQRVLAARLSHLPRRHRELVEACSLLEEEFTPAPLAALTALGVGGAPAELRRALDDLVDRWAMLVRCGPGRYAFTHPLYQEALAERTVARTEWAAALARWYETHRPDETIRIAHLYHLALDPDRALPWLRRALDESVREQAYARLEGILREIRTAVELRPRARRAHLDLELDLLERLWLGGAPVTEAIAREFLAESVGPWERLVGSCYVAVSLVLRRPDEARRLLGDLPRLASSVPPPRRREAMGVVAATSAYLRGVWGEWDRGLSDAEEAIRQLPRRARSVWRLSALLSRSYCLVHLRKYREAYLACEQTWTLVAPRPPSLFHALVLEQRATIAAIIGRPGQALRLREQAVRAARESPNPNILGEALAELVLSLLVRGEFDRARSRVSELRELIARFDLGQLEAWACYREGQLLWRAGNVAGSLPSFRSAADGFEASPRPTLALLPRAYLITRERNPRRIAAFRDDWLAHEAGLDAEEVSVIDPLRDGSSAFQP
jgi:hypothetical protein